MLVMWWSGPKALPPSSTQLLRLQHLDPHKKTPQTLRMFFSSEMETRAYSWPVSSRSFWISVNMSVRVAISDVAVPLLISLSIPLDHLTIHGHLTRLHKNKCERSNELCDPLLIKVTQRHWFVWGFSCYVDSPMLLITLSLSTKVLQLLTALWDIYSF